MNIISIILIAIGLAMDAFAVSITIGISKTESKQKTALLAALFFGGFQALMPLIGWLLGSSFIEYIVEVDHWIAFGLLALIGCRMIYESTKPEISKKIMDFDKLSVLFLLAIATSIDALAVGITFGILEIQILAPIIIIGLITFIISFIGVYIGKRLGKLFQNKIQIIGGLILIAIGLRILVEHLF
jgi:putative Mn2+ efflux pump MntP